MQVYGGKQRMDKDRARADWLLLFLSPEALGLDDEPLDPIRIQKGLFLLSIRGPERGLYSFRPYNWGPFSPDIYADLRWLEAQHLITNQTPPGQTWSVYRSTVRGTSRARQIAAAIGPDHVRWLAQARTDVGGAL